MVDIEDAELAWRLYTVLEAVGWRWTITEVLAQPERLLEDVLKVRGLVMRAEQQVAEARKGSEEGVLKAGYGWH